MTTTLDEIIAAARKLSLGNKLALLQSIVLDLQQPYEGTAQFWDTPALTEILDMQLRPVVMDIRTLAADFWPEDETADDINQFVAAQRHAGRLK